MNEESLLIIVDSHSRGYVQNISLVDKFSKIVIIDHHRRATDYIERSILSYIEPYASSTAELVTEMIQYMVEKPNISPIIAEALLAGIYVDTKIFTSKQVLEHLKPHLFKNLEQILLMLRSFC